MKQQCISVIGTGYVGLSTALGFTTKNYTVIASDCDESKIGNINLGKIPFHEPELLEQLAKANQKNKLKCVSNTKDAIDKTNITFVAVGTPSKPNWGHQSSEHKNGFNRNWNCT